MLSNAWNAEKSVSNHLSNLTHKINWYILTLNSLWSCNPSSKCMWCQIHPYLYRGVKGWENKLVFVKPSHSRNVWITFLFLEQCLKSVSLIIPGTAHRKSREIKNWKAFHKWFPSKLCIEWGGRGLINF